MSLHLIPLLALLISPLAATPYGLSSPDATPESLPEKLPALRSFPSWAELQPSADQWDFSSADALLATAKQNKTRIHGILHNPGKWAKNHNSSSGFPLDNTRPWASFVAKTVAKHPQITHWDILNAYNSTPIQINTPLHYVDLLTVAKREAKAENPEAQIGFVLADFDLEFLEQTLRSGSARYFDYISLAPYLYTSGSAEHLANTLPTLRNLLTEHNADPNIPVFITLTGTEKDLKTAGPIALSLGFEGVFLQTDPATLAEIPNKPLNPSSIIPDHSQETSVSLKFGQKPQSNGILQLDPSKTPWDSETEANRLHITAQPPVTRSSFTVSSSFITPETRELEITIEARRIPDESDQTNPTGFVLVYESIYGPQIADSFWSIPGDNKWHTNTWKITDAKFDAKYGWNFRIDASGAGNDLLIRTITITR